METLKLGNKMRIIPIAKIEQAASISAALCALYDRHEELYGEDEDAAHKFADAWGLHDQTLSLEQLEENARLWATGEER
jgi:inorganic triphosphatase YgiF